MRRHCAPSWKGGRATIGGLLTTIMSHPSLVVDLLANDVALKVIYLGLFFAPVLFLAVLDESTLGALAPFLGFAWLFTSSRAFYNLRSTLPAVRASVHLYRRSTVFEQVAPELLPRRVLVGALVVIIVASAGAGAQSTVEKRATPAINDHTRLLSTALDTVPSTASMVTQNTIYPHVAVRPDATFIPDPELFARYQQQYGTPTPQFVVFDTELNTRSVDWSRPVREAYLDRIGNQYGLYRYQDGIWVLKKGYNGTPTGITRENPSGRLVFEAKEFSTIRCSSRKRDGHQREWNERDKDLVWAVYRAAAGQLRGNVPRTDGQRYDLCGDGRRHSR